MDSFFIAQRNQRIILAGSIAMIGLLSFVQREQRALSLGELPPTPPSAFAAITPQTPQVGVSHGGSADDNSINRHARQVGRSAAPESANVAGLPSDTAGTGDGVATIDNALTAPSGTTPVALAALADSPNGPTGLGLFPGAASLQTLSPAGIGQSPAGDTPSAVPEGPTWLMMIMGFGGIGLLARRRRSREVRSNLKSA